MMYRFCKYWGCLLLVVVLNSQSKAQLIVTTKASHNAFPLASPENNISVYVDSTDAKVVTIAASLFLEDVKAVTGKTFALKKTDRVNDNTVIIAGTIGHSGLIDQLIRQRLIDVKAIENGWERFSIIPLQTKFQKSGKVLVIAGSDRRGTAYGLMYLSKLLGVHPFVWWADIPPAHKDRLYLSGIYTSKEPSVQYRGIFLNDEDWGLQPWAAAKMDTVIKDIGPNTYKKIFELMLRLRANYIWPAMHPCTKAFYYYNENPKLADDYAIVVGGSHCEPMLRNNVFEWTENFENEYGKKPGEWRYDKNKDEIYKYWDDRVKESKNYESLYTIGMRGIHDGSMPGPKDMNEKLKLLENVITDQRNVFNTTLKKQPSTVPQIFVPYKEVLDLYQKGMHLPGDISIIWPDDNYGYIRRLLSEEEAKRSGGHGVYYHLSYWGKPHDFLWLSSISPSLISYEMSRAYAFNAKRVWIFNVGDIKPAEEELQFAMDLAWDIKQWNPQQAYHYTQQWAVNIFGSSLGTQIAAIKNEYYKLAPSAKPEHMLKVVFTPTQAEQRLQAYESIYQKAKEIQKQIPAALQDAYFELILYPVAGACFMNEKILYAQKSWQLAKAGNKEALLFSQKSKDAYNAIIEFTNQYNSLANGKWKNMMSWHPRDLEVFKMPKVATENDLQKINSFGKIPSDTNVVMQIAAKDFTSKHSSENDSVITIKGLGIAHEAVTVLPFDFKAKNNDMPSVKYSVNLPKGNYTLLLQCLPTHAAEQKAKLPVLVGIDKMKKVELNMEVPAETNEWDKTVVYGYVERAVNFFVDKENATEIEIAFPVAGVVVNYLKIINIKK